MCSARLSAKPGFLGNSRERRSTKGARSSPRGSQTLIRDFFPPPQLYCLSFKLPFDTSIGISPLYQASPAQWTQRRSTASRRCSGPPSLPSLCAHFPCRLRSLTRRGSCAFRTLWKIRRVSGGVSTAAAATREWPVRTISTINAATRDIGASFAVHVCLCVSVGLFT